MLYLPDVTLVLIETREHELAQWALENCERQCEFADVLVFTDRPNQFSCAHRRVITVPDWPEKLGWSQCFWYEVPLHLRTSHALGIQWDSWIINPQAWDPAFLNYDYIGAPWWYEDGMNVGNGGFSLRSAMLLRYVRKHRARFPCVTSVDDDLYCRKYRPALQDEAGFAWAPEKLAQSFAFEMKDAPIGIKPFGFHAAFNFGKVLSPDNVLERARLMRSSAGISNSRIWKAFGDKHPEIVKVLESGALETLKQKEISDG